MRLPVRPARFHTPFLHAQALADRIELDAGGNAPITLNQAARQCLRGLLRRGRAQHNGMPIS